MRFYCGVNSFILFFVLFSIALSAQVIPDSIPAGVISVKRPAIQPAYRVHITMMYPEAKRNPKRITEFSSQQIVLSDTIFNPLAPKPSPGYMVPGNDSNHIVLGETFTGAQFNWQSYLSRISFKFAWSDSTKLDSARFIYRIDKNGNAECTFLPWINSDSSGSEFAGKAATFFLRLKIWSPARRVKRVTSDGKTKKAKKVACMIILTVYAYDPNAGRILPIELMGK
ncbi:MAG: hypothetical protein ABIQ40_12965 [Bacteroidia bacterium]